MSNEQHGYYFEDLTVGMSYVYGKTVTDADMPSYAGGYHRVDVDVTPWADGGTYTLRFSGSIQGSGLTSFFLDEVSVTSCSMDGTGTDSAPAADVVEGADAWSAAIGRALGAVGRAG